MQLTQPIPQMIKSGTLYAWEHGSSSANKLVEEALNSCREEFKSNPRGPVPSVASIIDIIQDIENADKTVLVSAIQSYPYNMDFEDNLGTTVLSQILESQTTEILDQDYWDDREQ